MRTLARAAGGGGVGGRAAPAGHAGAGLRRAATARRAAQVSKTLFKILYNSAPFNGALYIMVHHLMVRYI